MKYRKRPVVIEARQWDGSYLGALELKEWIGQNALVSDGFVTQLYIETLEGTHRAGAGDFIIKGIKGEFYPCKPDIFEQTYELVSGQE